MKKTINRWIAALRSNPVAERSRQTTFDWLAWLAAGRQGRSMNG